MTNSPACTCCNGRLWLDLSQLAGQAMLSDGRTIDRPLAKSACLDCGLVRHTTPLTAEELTRIFSVDYTLYDHPPGRAFERQRQHAYAGWILDLVGDSAVKSVFEVGSGNGSLLSELRLLRPSWSLSGIEPAPAAAEAAREAGLDVQTAFLSPGLSPRRADLVICINVLEHVENPVAFLRLLIECATPKGRVVVICPDGDQPSTELLIYDHVHSFSSHALWALARQTALLTVQLAHAPEVLGPFQAVVLARSGHQIASAPPIVPNLKSSRIDYLNAWQELDKKLLARSSENERIDAFGMGEAAGLLRAYAPRTWANVECVTCDGGNGLYAGLPVIDYSEYQPNPTRQLLLAVRPAIQALVARRLEADGHRVLRWDDLIMS